MSETQNNIKHEERKTLPLAKWTFRFAISGVVIIAFAYIASQFELPDVVTPVFAFLAIFWFVCVLPCLFIMSLISLVKASANRKKIKGLWQAGIGLVVCLVCLGMVLHALLKLPELVDRMFCGTHLSGIGKALNVYAAENDNLYPPADNWCDLLIEHAECPATIFMCRSDGTVGESSYAINVNAAGKDCREIPADMVVLFETDYGKGEGARDGRLSDRHFYIMDKEGLSYPQESTQEVYTQRWNQSGEIEIATAEHHVGDGMNVLFGDGSVSFVSAKQIGKLRWTVEEPNE